MAAKLKYSPGVVRNQSGSAALEAALALPFFFALLMGLIGIGQMFISYLSVGDALRQASRAAMVTGSDCQNAALAQINNAVSTYYFPPRIAGLTVNIENRGNVRGAVFEVNGTLRCTSCGIFVGNGFDFTETTFVPLESDQSCS